MKLDVGLLAERSPSPSGRRGIWNLGKSNDCTGYSVLWCCWTPKETLSTPCANRSFYDFPKRILFAKQFNAMTCNSSGNKGLNGMAAVFVILTLDCHCNNCKGSADRTGFMVTQPFDQSSTSICNWATTSGTKQLTARGPSSERLDANIRR